MFIELAELLLCPGPHDETYCVLATEEMRGRRVVSGVVGCPACGNEYPITDGVVEFGPDPLLEVGSRSDDLTVEEMPETEVVRALLGLGSPGGYVAVVGSAARAAGELAVSMSGVHYVAVNAPPEVSESDTLSLLRAHASIPVRSSTMRGVVVGKEYAVQPWLAEAARIVLKGLNLVVTAENAEIPAVEEVAVGRGLWVGRKTG